MLKWVPLPEPIILPPSLSLITRTVDGPGFPCRCCLNDGLIGETMHLISYNPFPASAENSPYQGAGPIFVHSEQCSKYAGTEIPEQQRRRFLAVRAYDKDHMMVDFAVLQGEGLVEKASSMFGDEQVCYLHVHNAGPGCFAVKVARA